MDIIKDFASVNFLSVFISIFIIIFAIVAIIEIVGKFSAYMGKPFKWVKGKNEDHDIIKQLIKTIDEIKEQQNIDREQSIKHDKMIQDDLLSLANTVNGIAGTLDDMQRKLNNTEMATLKDKLLLYYKKYKDIGEWDEFESEVFWELYDSYISHGGNSFVKNEIEPVMREMKTVAKGHQ